MRASRCNSDRSSFHAACGLSARRKVALASFHHVQSARAAMSDAVDVEADVGTNPAGTTGDAGGGAGPITTVTDLPVSATTTTVFQVTID